MEQAGIDSWLFVDDQVLSARQKVNYIIHGDDGGGGGGGDDDDDDEDEEEEGDGGDGDVEICVIKFDVILVKKLSFL
jgi:hypothetical protein